MRGVKFAARNKAIPNNNPWLLFDVALTMPFGVYDGFTTCAGSRQHRTCCGVKDLALQLDFDFRFDRGLNVDLRANRLNEVDLA